MCKSKWKYHSLRHSFYSLYSRHIWSLLSPLIELFQIPGWNIQPLKPKMIRIIPASTRSSLKGDHAANVMCYNHSSSLCLANLFSISAPASQASSLERLSQPLHRYCHQSYIRVMYIGQSKIKIKTVQLFFYVIFKLKLFTHGVTWNLQYSIKIKLWVMYWLCYVMYLQ